MKLTIKATQVAVDKIVVVWEDSLRSVPHPWLPSARAAGASCSEVSVNAKLAALNEPPQADAIR